MTSLGPEAKPLTARQRATLRMRTYRERQRDVDRLSDDALFVCQSLIEGSCHDPLDVEVRDRLAHAAVDIAMRLRAAAKAALK